MPCRRYSPPEWTYFADSEVAEPQKDPVSMEEEEDEWYHYADSGYRCKIPKVELQHMQREAEEPP